MLQVKNISIGFKGNSLYKELDFTILPGQLTALLGRNGTGKTTLLRVLAGFRKPLSGEVLLNGQTCTAWL